MRLLFTSFVACVLWTGCRTGSGARGTSSWREQARTLAADGKQEKAYELLWKAWQRQPEDLALARELAAVGTQAGKAQELLGRLDRAAFAPEYARLFVRGLALFARPAESGRAIEALRGAIALRPGLAELHHRLGRALLEVEDFPAAIAALEQSVMLAPDLTGAYLPLAKAQAQSGNKGAAVETLRKWLQRGPAPEEVPQATALMDELADPFAGVPPAAAAKIEQGLFWLEQRDVPQEALRYFEEVLAEYPDLGIVHALAGLCHQRLDDAGRALESFRRAIELAPEQGKYHQYVGELYASRQRLAPARDALENAVRLHPLLSSAHARLGQLALQSRDLPAARSAFEAWVALSPGAAAPKLELALVHQLMGDHGPSEALLLEVLRENPTSLEAKLRLGLLYVEMHRRAAGEERARVGRAAKDYLGEVLREQPHNVVASRALQSLGTR